MIAKGAGLRRASASAGNRVPTVRTGSPGRAGRRVDVENREFRTELPEIDEPLGRLELKLRYLEPDEMDSGSVVDRSGQIRWKLVDAHAAP
jgi:hypothetical protein